MDFIVLRKCGRLAVLLLETKDLQNYGIEKRGPNGSFLFLKIKSSFLIIPWFSKSYFFVSFGKKIIQIHAYLVRNTVKLDPYFKYSP